MNKKGERKIRWVPSLISISVFFAMMFLMALIVEEVVEREEANVFEGCLSICEDKDLKFVVSNSDFCFCKDNNNLEVFKNE